jgi:hypothetical protein
MQQTMNIAGRIILEGRPRANLSVSRVKLSRTAVEFDQRFEAPAGVDGDFVLEHVSPAAPYDIVVDPLPPGAYIKGITSGGRNVLGGASPLVPDAPLMIVLAESPENLDVRVTNGASPSAGVQVVLVPEPALRRRADRYITGFTDVDGTLQLTGVPPGQYTAYAFEDIEPGAYYALAYNPGVDNRFRDRALPVTVGGPQGAKAIRLRVVTAPETAGGLQ